MKVLVGIPCLLTGGTEIQTLSLVEAQGAAGHEVVVVAYFEYAEAMVRRYREAGARVELLSADGVRPKGLTATVIHLWRGIRRVVRAERPEVAHVQYMAPGALPIVILRALGVRKIIATTHTAGDIYGKNGLRVIRFLTRYVLTAFQCITEIAERSYFGSSRLFDGRLSRHFTIYNSLPAHISLRESPRRPLAADAPVTVGVVSRLERIKGMDLVIPAFALAARDNSRLRLLVVGDGALRPLMERQAAELGLQESVEFLGRQPQSELQACYDRIDILLMPSRSEGFGLTAIEGMARGCVPVVADVGGLPEVVAAGCGFLHESESVDDLAQKMLAAAAGLTDGTVSANAIRRAELFSPVNYRRQINELYSALPQ